MKYVVRVFPTPIGVSDRVWPDVRWRRCYLMIRLRIRNHRTRRALRGMEPHRLKDIGVDRVSAERESRTPFWR